MKRTRRFFRRNMETPVAYAGPPGFGHWNDERRAPPFRSAVTGPFVGRSQKMLALACGFGHLRGPLCGAPLHLLGSYVLDVLREAPLVAKWVREFSIAVAPELIH